MSVSSCLLVLSGLLTTQSGVESATDGVSIGVLDNQHIWDHWVEYQQLVEQLESMHSLDQKDIDRLQAEINERRTELERDRKKGYISDEDYEKAERVISRRARDLLGYVRIRDEIVQDRIQTDHENRKDIIREKLMYLADEKGLGLILKNTAAAYYDDHLEIGPAVTDMINRSDRVRKESERREPGGTGSPGRGPSLLDRGAPGFPAGSDSSPEKE